MKKVAVGDCQVNKYVNILVTLSIIVIVFYAK